jgi:hypothetical protein
MRAAGKGADARRRLGLIAKLLGHAYQCLGRARRQALRPAMPTIALDVAARFATKCRSVTAPAQLARGKS